MTLRLTALEARWRTLLQSTSSPAVEKCYNRSDSRLKFVDREDDLDFLCEGFPSPRALMSCGHAVTPMSLTKWCLKQLEQGKSRFACVFCKNEWTYEEVCRMALLTPEEKEHFDWVAVAQGKSRFVCGLCNAEWTYEEVCRMALLTHEEKKHFERTMALNDVKTRNCPDCLSFVMRQDESDLCVHCSVCTKKKGKAYEFCWQCLREWKGPKPRSDRCGNRGCCDPALETLMSCPDLPFEWGGVRGCPSIRACPTCGSLLEHSGRGCSNIRCTKCKMQFCFVCLRTTAECLRTLRYYDDYDDCLMTRTFCVVAPRQTSIPVWKK